MPTARLPNEHHLCRLVKRSHQVTDGQGNPIGISWAAFDLREDEKYLSANCVEQADQDRAAALKAILICLQKKFSRTSSCLLTVGKIENIKASFLPHAVRITSESKPSDPSYAAVRQYPPTLTRQLALEKLAASAWADWVKTQDL